MTRYTTGARFYDVLSGEWPVYRAGRLAGLRLLRPARGGVVLDVGCGTGLNLPLLAHAVGADGLVIGLDSSTAMLEVARRRTAPYGGAVQLLEQDAMHLQVDAIEALLRDHGRRPHVQALFSSYALSVIPDWRIAWAGVRPLLEPGARVGVVDMQPPRLRLMRPLAALAAAAGGADLRAAPWRLVQEDCTSVVATEVRGGHIVAAAGSYAGRS